MLLTIPENIEIVKQVRKRFSIDLPLNLMQRLDYLDKLGADKREYRRKIMKYTANFITDTDYWKKYFGEKIRLKVPQDYQFPKNTHKSKKRKQPPNLLAAILTVINLYAIGGINQPIHEYFASKLYNDEETFQAVYRLAADSAGANLTDKEIKQMAKADMKVHESRKFNNMHMVRDTYYLQIKIWNPGFTYSQIAEYLWEECPEDYGFKDYQDYQNQMLTPEYEKKLKKFSKNIEKSINRLKLWFCEICDS